MTSSKVIKARAQRKPTSATRILDSRLSAHEGKRRDEQAARARQSKNRWLAPTAVQEETLPHLCHYLMTHGGWLPSVPRGNPQARVKRLEAMYSAHGPLVLLTTELHSLNCLGLQTVALARRGKSRTMTMLKKLTVSACPFDAVLQRGGFFEGTHSHVVLPLSFFNAEAQALLLAAPRGSGGGCQLKSGVHGVVIGDTSQDRQRVAGYLNRHPDGRLYLPLHRSECLAAYEELLLRRKRKVRSKVRLAWHRKSG
ncbi:hypothetical protein EHF33_20880 (plasmid) [Deinococcus psychrotolerans]|uniref:Uncharacterized protein n=1 Tax=Deinococcus psychrotolerans TaxID=2489213 RepID=A0A3G8YJC3_9DEIO|nr:hypothetical protein [Deinococcus psychrotolerans]AZI45368.1 hypothetical protein EHF33_20880 [Deinococcus psychrotolerans]